jgi:hypothetical protein
MRKVSADGWPYSIAGALCKRLDATAGCQRAFLLRTIGPENGFPRTITTWRASHPACPAGVEGCCGGQAYDRSLHVPSHFVNRPRFRKWNADRRSNPLTWTPTNKLSLHRLTILDRLTEC